MGFRRVRALVVSLLLLLTWPLAARAEQGSALVVLIDPGSPALSLRLEEEIEALGLSVIKVAEIEPGESLESRARSARAVAAIRVMKAGTGFVEMTIVDRATGKTVSRRLAIATPADPASAELVATRTVELLRASLMELSASHPPRGDAPVTEAVEALAAPPAVPPRASAERRGSRVTLSLGPAVVFSPSLGSTANAWAGLTLFGPSRVGLSVQGLLPLQAHRLDTEQGTIEVMASSYRVAVVLDLPLVPNRLSGRLLAGAMLTRVTAQGDTASPFVGEKEDFLTGGPWLGIGLELDLSSTFGVFAGTDCGLSLPRTVIRSAGRELVSFGRPLCTGSAGVSVSWH